ncbi:MAG TPA: MFS transporter [Candidatus Limnocylindria bacterium]|nr:MFS transporter [Candidatus Limnocylindria bacterium]
MGRYRALFLLALAMVLAMSTWFSASAVLPQLRALWSLSSGESAWLTIAVQLGFVTGALGSAITNLPDRFSARHVVFVSTLAAAAANAGLVLADGPATALALRFVTGFFVAGIYPPVMKVMATHFQRGRGVALGLMIGGLTLGSATPHLVNGLGGLDWRTVIVVTSLLTVAGGLVVLLFVREGPYPFPRAVFQPKFILRASRDPAVRLVNFGYFGHMWELYAMWSWFGAYFAESLRVVGVIDARLAAFGTFVVVGAGAVGCYAGGVLGDRWGRTRTTALAMALSGTCAALSAPVFGAAPALVLALGVVWGITVIADSAQFSTMITEIADQSYVGTALTAQMAAGFLLTVATIWIIPLMRDAVGWQWAFLVLVPGPALGVLAMLRLARRPEAARIAGGRG